MARALKTPKSTKATVAPPPEGANKVAEPSMPEDIEMPAGEIGGFNIGMPFLAMPAVNYMADAMQRTVLFWDVMRRRSEDYYSQKAMPVPNVLKFGTELILDGRSFHKPVNYLLVRVEPPQGVVVDPRAGHGPGIGGFKADSELGVAMRAGHPAYFVGFTPDPEPGQTIEDIMWAEAMFLEKVIALHPDAEGKPCVIGNCQAGWAVMMLAAVRPELFGPIIVPGSPLSYWAGVKGKNPMRYLGGLMGGSWLTALTSDLGAGTFDGAHLVENFENANPSNTYWTKSYDVWSKVDTEAERFLDFEKWWGGHVNLNAEEIQWIVDELFIGNRLATAEIVTSNGIRVDLRNIRSPIICFCSQGDNITPPQQALGWIIDLYEHDDDIKANGQTIVYTVHESVGHLGIFVSGGIARKQHQEFTSNIDLIDILPPGLCEAVLTAKTDADPNADMASGDWIVRFEPRTLGDIRAIVQPDPEDERRFAAVRSLSEINLGLYRTLLQPFVQAFASTQGANWLHKLNPAELPYELFSEKNPLVQQIAGLAEQVREQRVPSVADTPLASVQEMISSQIVSSLDTWRDLRDQTCEQIFLTLYGQPVVQALLGLRANDAPPRRRPGIEPEEQAFIEKRIAELRARVAQGDHRDAFLRGLVYVGLAGPGVDERAFAALNTLRNEYAPDLTLSDLKDKLREQFFAVLLDQKAAIAAIPAMLDKDPEKRKRALDGLRHIVTAVGKPEGLRAERLAEIEALFGIDA
jgi:hypothetical protein